MPFFKLGRKEKEEKAIKLLYTTDVYTVQSGLF